MIIKNTIVTILLIFLALLFPTNKYVNSNFLKKINKDLSLHNDTILASQFGIKADFDGRNGTDNTDALQKLINYASQNKQVIKFPEGVILVNSFAKNKAGEAHGNILELKSNLNIDGKGSEIIIGDFFNDKNFIFLSGFNHENPDRFTPLNNITINNVQINFNGQVSKMNNKYLLRKGIEFGHTTNVVVNNSTFYNGDLSCAIATGYGNIDNSKYIVISNNNFINLIQESPNNLDHSTIYINSQFSLIINNIFENYSKRGKLVACAVEFHNSNNEIINNVVSGYTRFMYLATTESENHHIKNLKIYDNKVSITNAAIYLWLEKNTSMKNILIENNETTCHHVDGESMAYNGTQGLLSDAREDKNTEIKSLIVRNNKIKINNTAFRNRAIKYATKYKFVDNNNICQGCTDGIFYKE